MTWRAVGLAALCLLPLALRAAVAQTEVLHLVSEEEAREPAQTSVASKPDLSEGPTIEVRSPTDGTTYRDSFPIEVVFGVGPSGLPVNPDSLRLTYERAWGIDITSRVKEYTAPDGIRVPAADFPAGEHSVRIYLEDVEHNASRRRITIRVAAGDG